MPQTLAPFEKEKQQKPPVKPGVLTFVVAAAVGVTGAVVLLTVVALAFVVACVVLGDAVPELGGAAKLVVPMSPNFTLLKVTFEFPFDERSVVPQGPRTSVSVVPSSQSMCVPGSFQIDITST